MNRALEDLLKEAIGLDVASIGAAAVERAVHQRMAATNRTTMGGYIELVRGSEAELQQLIEAVVVPETWFLRDSQAFVLLSQWALESWLPRNARGPLRLLSLPCSTGEEPYSMAITLLQAGFPADRLSIDAVDISECSLALARRAIYGRNSFRGEDLGFRGSYFEAEAGSWRLSKSVQMHVRFQQGNLFSDDLLAGSERFDVIFCRNVLIYFDRETQDRAVGVLRRLKAPQGLVFVGPSETSLLLSHDFEPVKASLAFAFKARDAVASAKKKLRVRVTTLPHIQPSAAPPVSVAPRPESKARDKANSLHRATALADAGRFAEAAASCEEHIRRYGPAAEAFRLQAMIFAGAGNPDSAAANYRSALYLDPNDYESLIHLALLLEKRGDAAGAKVLQGRARRLESRVKAEVVP
jgi:chemotaxis protein methyltransferase WspC